MVHSMLLNTDEWKHFRNAFNENPLHWEGSFFSLALFKTKLHPCLIFFIPTEHGMSPLLFIFWDFLAGSFCTFWFIQHYLLVDMPMFCSSMKTSPCVGIRARHTGVLHYQPRTKNLSNATMKCKQCKKWTWSGQYWIHNLNMCNLCLCVKSLLYEDIDLTMREA